MVVRLFLIDSFIPGFKQGQITDECRIMPYLREIKMKNR
jgi:hypothetical protein